MWIPFKPSLDRLFRSDRSAGLKVLGCAFVGGMACLTTVARQEEGPPPGGRVTPAMIVLFGLAGAVLGGWLGLMLSLKDVVRDRIERGEDVNPLLTVYLGGGCVSLVVWSVTVFVLTIAFTIVSVL